MKLEQTKVYGGIGGGEMGYAYGWMWYDEEFQIKFSCPFHFQNFPFDSHKCCFEYKERGWNSSFVQLAAAEINYWNMTTNEGLISVRNLPFPFELMIESKPAFVKRNKYESNYYTGMCFKMKRNSYGQLIGGFYYPTLSFAVLSLVSYLIKPDIVSTSYFGADV